MTNPQTTKQYRAGRPDGQAFDNILIRTEPRFKESELSGDEWRISAVTEFYRKGKLMHSVRHGNADILDPDDGEAFIGEVFSGIVLERFETLREAKAMLKNNPLHYERIAKERLAHAKS